MNKKRKEIDFAAIIALKEEFELVRSSLGLTVSKDFNEELGTWYKWLTSTIDGKEITCYFSFIGKMGPAHAINFTTKFLEYYTPKVLLSFGLSGSLDSDVKLGDIVVANLVDLYDDAGALKDINDDVDIQLSGAPYDCSYFKEHTDNFSLKYVDRYQRWREETNRLREKYIDEIGYAALSQLLGQETSIHTGHVACGSFLVASNMFKKEIKNKDRKYLAVDMESAGIALSASNKYVSKNSDLLVVRAISDPADERKKDLDNLEEDKSGAKGAIRKWALMNAINFLKEFIPTVPVFSSQTSNNGNAKYQFALQDIVPEVRSAYDQIGPDIINKYEEFFHFFINNQPKWKGIDGILHRIEMLPQSQDGLASITGCAGTGKSALLSCIYLRQMERFNSKESKFFPIYINIRRTLNPDEDIESSASQFEQFFKQKTSTDIIKECNNILLIIDGCYEYLRNTLQSKIDQMLPMLIKEVSKSRKVLKVFGVGNNEDNEFLKERSCSALSWASSIRLLVSLRRVETSNSSIKKIIAAYTALLPNANDISMSIEKAILSFCLTEIDLYTFSIINNYITRKWKKGDEGLGYLYYRTCIEKIRQISLSRSLTNDQVRTILHNLAEEIFNKYIKRDFTSLHQPSQYHSYHSIAYQHPTIKEFLIAEHVVEKVSLGEINSGLFECIYPYGINRFVKSILNRTVDVQSKALKGIRDNFEKQNTGQKAHLAYILGRFSDTGLKMEAEKLLRSNLQSEKKNSSSKKNATDPEFRTWLMLQRTIYISLICLNNRRAADEYLDKIYSNSDWDDLNRGFHLEYYEDTPKVAGSPLMISFDNIKIPPKRTYEVLYSKINDDICLKKDREMTLIDLYTLCSLCLNRHIDGLLMKNKRLRLIGLIQRALNVGGLINKTEFRAYLYMAIEMLEYTKVSTGTVALQLLNLKNTKRAGWNSSRIFEGKTIKRKCPSPESVADHTFGCLLLAELFLPEKYHKAGYSKTAILRILLIHDLGEAFLGDKAKYDKTQIDSTLEHRRMMRIASLKAIKKFQGMKKCGEYWNKYHTQNGINYEISKDIDL